MQVISQHAEPLVCRMVAHHSCAVIEAEERGLAHVMTREFAPPPQHLAEIHDRDGSGHLVSRFISRATPLILEAVGHVHARTASSHGAVAAAYSSFQMWM